MHGPAERAEERAVEEDDLRDAREQQARVQHDHGGKVPEAVLDAAAREGAGGMALRDDEFDEALDTREKNEADVQDHAHDNPTLMTTPAAQARR